MISVRAIVLAALAGASTAAPWGPGGEQAKAGDWKAIEPPLKLSFPRDHGSHPEFRTEWWYVTGEGVDAAGERLAWQLTIFRNGLQREDPGTEESSFRPHQVFAAHLAVHAVSSARVEFAQRIRRDAGGIAGAAEGHLHAWVEDWEIRAIDGPQIQITASDRERGIALDLKLLPIKPAVQHGMDGVSRKGSDRGNASAYYSHTRLETSGRMTIGGQQRTVRGESWLDHEWGTTQLGAGVVGWDWFALRIGDGSDLMIYRLRLQDGTPIPQSSGTLVDRQGRATFLGVDEFALEILDHWESPRTKARYPSRWRLRVPEHGIAVEIVPRIADAELDSTPTTSVIYWEGSVEVLGSHPGTGFVELTGYAHSMAGRF